MNTYSKEFKKQALQLADEIGVRKTAEQLGIPYGTVSNWRKSKNRYQGVKEKKDTLPLSLKPFALSASLAVKYCLTVPLHLQSTVTNQPAPLSVYVTVFSEQVVHRTVNEVFTVR